MLEWFRRAGLMLNGARQFQAMEEDILLDLARLLAEWLLVAAGLTTVLTSTSFCFNREPHLAWSKDHPRPYTFPGWQSVNALQAHGGLNLRGESQDT